jgi:hypothetical protein
MSLGKVTSMESNTKRLRLAFHPRWPIFKLYIEIIKTHLQTNFMDIWWTIVASREFTRFSIFSSCDLVFHQRYPYSNSSNQLTRQASWPSLMRIESQCKYKSINNGFPYLGIVTYFWPQVIHNQTWPTNHQNNLPDQFQGYLDQNSSH